MKNAPTIIDEARILEELFNYAPGKRNKLYNLTVIGESNQVFARAIIKYLLHIANVSPYVAEEVVRKYMVIFVYSFLKERFKHFDLNVPYFDKVLENEVHLDDLLVEEIDNVNIFTDLFNKKDGKKYLEECKELKKIIIEDGAYTEKKAESIVNILRKDNHYFTDYKDRFDNLFEFNVRNYDEMIAEGLLDNEFFKFKIHVDDDNMEAFFANFFDNKSLDDVKKIRKVIFGYIVYDAMLNDNLSLEKPVRTLPSKQVKLYLGMKNATTCDKAGHSVMKFLDKNIYEQNVVNFTKVVPFYFEFNDVKYQFTEKGIIKA